MDNKIKPIYDREKYTTVPSDFEYVGPDRSEGEKIYKPSLTYWQDAWRRLKKNKVAMFFLGFLAFAVFIAVFGQHLTKFKYFEQITDDRFLSPLQGFKLGHYLGTDSLGRDIFARISQGIRISMILSIIVAAICVVIGTIYGAMAAYFGGIIDLLMVRFIEVLIAVPSMIYIILLMVVLGNSVETIVIALSLTRWLGYALLIRGEVLKLKENEYVMASTALGSNFWWIIKKHLIPNTLSIIIVKLTMDIPSIIFSEAFLSFIGLGVPIPQASLGNLVSDGFREISSHAYLFIIPALAISLITLAFNVLGDALSDALNPKLRD
ncbi:ABC transporter permease [Oceanivirga miroungae]|uniref:Binding-protein-dependent transport system inner membrane protein n=1 Tax=Oceanivirga miroungae TaxID=1130046 RepID=A0A6I8MEM9_9FUSO|nr:ABC transporter permease [Oceanivirga miroungae]VWL85679.1 binding-protein-dependent transport system inner membrane protein [Oceanivirga miroungae]